MKIHREGFNIILPIAAIFLSGFSLCLSFNARIEITFAITFILFLTLLGVIGFFRVPKRKVTENENAVICPADGKIVVIEKVFEKEFFKDERWQISIFMSPLNVHVNSYPVSGKVIYTAYNPGKFSYAAHPKASELNESTTIVVQKENGVSVLFRQIAGALAKRIVCYSKPDDIAVQAHEMGIIKFGSRVDVFLPLDIDIQVKIGQKVRGKQTVLALFSK